MANQSRLSVWTNTPCTGDPKCVKNVLFSRLHTHTPIRTVLSSSMCVGSLRVISIHSHIIRLFDFCIICSNASFARIGVRPISFSVRDDFGMLSELKLSSSRVLSLNTTTPTAASNRILFILIRLPRAREPAFPYQGLLAPTFQSVVKTGSTMKAFMNPLASRSN